MTLDVIDLNVPPPDIIDQMEPSASTLPPNVQASQLGGFIPPAPIDLEALDDDVVISSPSAFAEAKNKSRRTRGRALVVDVDSEDRSTRLNSNNPSKRRRVPPNQTIINCDAYVERETVQVVAQLPVPPAAAPPEPTFNCPVCMGPIVEEVTTKCGHIFCKECIKAAIGAQSKCPTCRRKVTMKDIFRVYLPSAN